VPSLIGMILGYVGLRRARIHSARGRPLACLALWLSAASLLFGGCVVTVLSIAMLRASETANRAMCSSQMNAIRCSLQLYANENRGWFPQGLDDLVRTQDITTECFVCPSSSDTKAVGATVDETLSNLTAGGHLSYVYTGQNMRWSQAASVVLMHEPLTNHGDGAHFVFGDGSIQFIGSTAAQQIISQLQAGQNPPRLPSKQ
jgi:hypothetical protein